MQEPTRDNFLDTRGGYQLFVFLKEDCDDKAKTKILLILIYLSFVMEKRKQTYVVRFDCLT